MPLYNAEDFLSESIESILSQSFYDFELICVDDSSNDGTYNIVKSFQERDERIMLYTNEERKGAAYSRNRGIELSNGEFLLFLDGDDLFEKQLIELCYNTALNKNVDIVFYNYGHFESDRIHETTYSLKDKDYYIRYASDPFSFSYYADPDMIYSLCATCNKFYKKEFITDNSLRFQDIPRQNDVRFSILSLLISDKVVALDDDRMMVHARDHENPSRITNNRDPFCIYYAIKSVLDELSKRNLMDRAIPKFYHIFLDLLIFMIKMADREKGEQYYTFLRNQGLPSINKDFYINRYCIDDYAELRRACFIFDYNTLWWKHNEVEWIRCLLRLLEKPLGYYMAVISSESNGVVLWGCGAIGRLVISIFKDNDIQIRGITDSNPKMFGVSINDYCVTEFSELYYSKIFVITTSRKIDNDEIKDKYKDIKVVSIFSLLSEVIKNMLDGKGST